MIKFRPHHTALSVRDIEASKKFYEVFGFTQVHRFDESDGSMTIVHMKLDQLFLELFYFPENANQPALELQYANNLSEIGVKHIALQVDDVQQALEELKKVGIANESTKITVGKTNVQYFFVQDPDGVWVEVLRDNRYS